MMYYALLILQLTTMWGVGVLTGRLLENREVIHQLKMELAMARRGLDAQRRDIA